MQQGIYESQLFVALTTIRLYRQTLHMKKDPYPFDISPNYWLYQVRIKSDAVLRKAFQAAGHDLTPEQWSVLARLYEDEGMNQCQLGEKTLKDRHNVTRILNRLEKKGLIERRRSPGDNRSFRIYLTKEGRKVERKLSSITLGQGKLRYKGMSGKEIQLLKSLLEKVLKNLGEFLSR